MSLNDNKPTYGTVPAVDSGATKGSRRGLVVGLVRPRARKSIHGAFVLDPMSATPTRRVFLPGGGGLLRSRLLRSFRRHFDPAVNTGAGMPGAGGEDVGFGVPHSHKTTPGGGVAAQGY